MGSKRILLIGAETLDRITDPDDRDTAILFGNGAGAVVIDAVPEGEPTHCSAGTSAPTAPPSTSSTPTSAATCRWTAGRSSAGPSG